VFLCQTNATGSLTVALRIDAAKSGFKIKKFTGDVRVINTPLEIYFFEATSTALAANGLPALLAESGIFFHTGKLPNQENPVNDHQNLVFSVDTGQQKGVKILFRKTEHATNKGAPYAVSNSSSRYGMYFLEQSRLRF